MSTHTRSNVINPNNAITANKHIDMHFYSLYVLGEGFYSFHKDGLVSSFENWVRSHQNIYYESNRSAMNLISQLSSIEQLMQNLYDKTIIFNDPQKIIVFFRRWYAETYHLFRFNNEDSFFVTNGSKILLKVLYGIDEDKIILFNNQSDNSVLDSIPICQNNWYIDCFGADSALKKVFSIMLDKGTLPTSHYKFISNDGVLPVDVESLCKQHGISNLVSLDFTKVTTIPNIETMNARFHRYDEFTSFGESAKTIFVNFQERCSESQKFQDYYMLNIWSNGNIYNKYITILNIAWGCRPISAWRSKDGFTSTVEEGARICISRNDDGYLTVLLFPAHTETRRQVEDSIVLKSRISPSKLQKTQFQKKLWRALLAYMEVTSVDGDASMGQTILIDWYRFVKHTIRNNEFLQRKISICALKILEFSLTVGLSGFILTIIEKITK